MTAWIVGWMDGWMAVVLIDSRERNVRWLRGHFA